MEHLEDMDTLGFIFRNSAFRLGILLVFFVAKAACITKRQQPPRFLPTPTNVTVHRDDTAVLMCIVEHLGPKTVVWRKVSEDFPLSVGEMMYAPNDEMSIDVRKYRRNKSQYNLIIKRAQPHHSGTYECQISAARVYTYHIHLIVKKIPAIYTPVINLTGTEYVNMYQKINLTCNATGADRAPDDIDWFHEGHKIYTRDPKWRNRVEITKYKPEIPGRSLISSLVIERSKLNDTGSYVCRSSDLDTTSIKIHVLNADKDISKRNKEAANGKVKKYNPIVQEKQTKGPNSAGMNKVSVYVVVTLQLILHFIYSIR